MHLTIVYNTFDYKQANVSVIPAISRKRHISRFHFLDMSIFVLTSYQSAWNCKVGVAHSYRTPENTTESRVLSDGENCMKLCHGAGA
jgi:hypothetical protein